ncbi:thioredoxin family protein [Kaistella sp. PBT33-4]|uniref:thioredoxin family protein n=1 Tax=Kaistella sp. PBT33-4 TaxID=3032000 RepID=UPI0023D85733|nr:thioredoxin family protein [Kaistella sp. PBT33-4]MDF0720898.1 thioredoxin family protein [Kaistella sp. PBT33-4]
MMKYFVLLFILSSNIFYSQLPKNNDWNVAQEKAQKSGKNILIILTGSEWCKPCIKMKKNVIETIEFEKFANESVEIFEINLPRNQDLNSKVVMDYQYFKNKFKTNALPSLILLDKEGNELVKISDGLASKQKVISKLSKYN